MWTSEGLYGLLKVLFGLVKVYLWPVKVYVDKRRFVWGCEELFELMKVCVGF